MFAIILNTLFVGGLITYILNKYILDGRKISIFNSVSFIGFVFIGMFLLTKIYLGDYNYGDLSYANIGTFKYSIYEEILKVIYASFLYIFITSFGLNLIKFNINRNENTIKLFLSLLLISGLSYILFENNIYLYSSISDGTSLSVLFNRIVYSSLPHIFPFVIGYVIYKKVNIKLFKLMLYITISSILFHFIYNSGLNSFDGSILLIFKTIISFVIIYVYGTMFFFNIFSGNKYKTNIILK